MGTKVDERGQVEMGSRGNRSGRKLQIGGEGIVTQQERGRGMGMIVG